MSDVEVGEAGEGRGVEGGVAKKDDEIESFMEEINEYYENMNKVTKNSDTEDEDNDEDEDDDSDSSYRTRSESKALKKSLVSEKAKVQSLKDVIKKQQALIEKLQRTIEGKEYENPEKQLKKDKSDKICRYWNRGFCKERGKCHFEHPEEDCRKFIKEGRCEKTICRNRHRHECKYFKQGSCFRGRKCEFIHTNKNENSILQEKRRVESSKSSRNSHEEIESFKCDFCNFKCDQNIILKKHINTEHKGLSGLNSVSNFIFRHGLEEFYKEYKYYFDKYGHSKTEEAHVKKMIGTFGASYILDYIK